MKIVFLGSADLACHTLGILLDTPRHAVVGVIAQPPRPAGRKRLLTPCPVHQMALDRGLEVITPEKIGDPESMAQLAAWTPDILVVFAYGQYIPSRVVNFAPHRAINLHPSLLPRYRGAAPIQWALANGDAETGVSIIAVDARMDAGDILIQEPLPIRPDDTAATLGLRAAERGGHLLVSALDGLARGSLRFTPQDESRATEVRKLSKEDGRIDWALPAGVIDCRVRAFDPWPGCFSPWPGLDAGPLRIWRVALEPAEGQPGEILEADPNHGPLVACGGQALRLIEVQPPGKPRMSGGAFVNGGQFKAGDSLPLQDQIS